MTIRVLSEADIRKAVPPDRAVETQRIAYRAVVDEAVIAGGGLAVEDVVDDTLVFAVTGAVRGRTAIACKFGFQTPHNSTRGLPAVHAFVTLVDQTTGVPLACLNGTTITTMRTAAGIAAAADALAVPNASRLAVVGSGVQAAEAVRMIAAVRALGHVSIAARSLDKARDLAANLTDELGVPVAVANSVCAAADGAHIVATCTSSRSPVLAASDLAPGATVLTVGSYAPDRAEIAPDVAEIAAAVFVDDLAKARLQCGPLLRAARLFPQLAQPVEIGRVLAGAVPGRRDDADVLVFHSVGVGVKDACLASYAVDAARQYGLGTDVAF